MQIQGIHSYNMSFGAIYSTSLIRFTPEQNDVIDGIINTLRSPVYELGNKSPEEYYKSKNGIDFKIDNSDQNTNSVLLKGVLGAKNIKDANRKAISYQNSFEIGVYSPEHKFDVKDIEYGLDKHKQKERSIIKTALIPILGLAALVGIYFCKKTTNPQSKPTIETLDSIGSKAKTAFADTLELNIKSLK
ncbi:hypothetical protein IKQ21_03025 [bacterium]|nr:hypothetical protein [bacterium]